MFLFLAKKLKGRPKGAKNKKPTKRDIEQEKSALEKRVKQLESKISMGTAIICF
jgi:hypothetical protein